MKSCIEACETCRDACTIYADELQRQGNDANAELCEACASQCKAAIAAMNRDSMRECGVCSLICAECAEMCASMDGDLASRCAEACAHCSSECGKMVAASGGQAMLF